MTTPEDKKNGHTSARLFLQLAGYVRQLHSFAGKGTMIVIIPPSIPTLGW
jgi:hypothetical protein